MAELVRIDPIGAGSRHPLSRTGSVIGRGLGCEIQISDLTISRRHVRISHTDLGWIVEDLSAANGLAVNGIRRRRSPLRERDHLRIGRCIFELRATHDHGPPPADDDAGGGGPATAQLLVP